MYKYTFLQTSLCILLHLFESLIQIIAGVEPGRALKISPVGEFIEEPGDRCGKKNPPKLKLRTSSGEVGGQRLLWAAPTEAQRSFSDHQVSYKAKALLR
jgi:hypothetical protein